MATVGKRSAWYSAFEANNLLVELFDRELRTQSGIPLEWYDVMIKIWLAPGKAVRMSELASQVLLSRSWLTRRVMQLEAAGLVERAASVAEDGRGVEARLTMKGKELFTELDAVHAASIERHFSSHISDEDAAAISRVFSAVAQSARDSLRHH